MGEEGRCLQERRIVNKVLHLLPFMAGIERHPPSFPLPPSLPPSSAYPPKGPLPKPPAGRRGVYVKSACFPGGGGGSESEPWEEY